MLLSAVFAALLPLAEQQPQPGQLPARAQPQQSQQQPQPPPSFRANVPVVLVPASITGARGKYVDGLEERDFTLLDNGRVRPVHVDTSDVITARLAAVVAIQANDTAAAANLKIRKTGSIVQPLITGERGSAAVILFGSEVSLEQNFTGDPDAIARAFHAIRTQDGKQARMLDAIAQGVALLKDRPQGERRVLIVIGESRDRGSQAKLDAVLEAVQRAGVTVYSVVYSAYVTPFTTRTEELPPAGSLDLLALITEPARLAKVNAAELLARESGGRKFGFATLKTLERDLSAVGEEVHSQYILSYPAPPGEPGFHRIEVRVNGRPQALVRARSGYWAE